MTDSYNMKKVLEVMNKLSSFIEDNELDADECTVSFYDDERGLYLFAHDNISKRPFGLGIGKKYKKKPYFLTDGLTHQERLSERKATEAVANG